MCTDRDTESRPGSSGQYTWLLVPLTICLVLVAMLPTFKSQPAPTVSKAPRVTTVDFESKVMQSQQMVLVWITQPYTSEPSLSPVLAKLADEMPVVRIERTDCALIAILLPGLDQLRLRGQSHYVLVKDGKVIATLIPTYEPTAEKLSEQLLYFVNYYRR